MHGYYSLPILHEGMLVGRLDPKLHREEGRLEVRQLHLEPSLASGRRDAALAGTAQALRSLAGFLGAKDVRITAAGPAARELGRLSERAAIS